MDLDLGAVRAFVAVADERSFSHAADRLGISQQAVSKRVARLEDDLGTTLLLRTHGGAEPTADGRSFLTSARALLGLADQAVELVRSRLRTFRVDVLGTRLASIEMIQVFHETAPDVEIDIVTSKGLANAEPALLAGTIDVFFGRATAGVDESLDRAPAYLEPLQILVGRDHPLAGRARLTMAELAGTTAWMPGNAHESEWVDFYRYLSADFSVATDPTGPNFGLEHFVERIASSPDVYSFIGEKTRVPWHPGTARIPLVDPTPVFPWSLIWHRQNRHPALPALIEHVAEGFRPFDATRQWLPPYDVPFFTGPRRTST
ncbi:LysR family transcriptional regulator [Spirillospora sp. NPDC047279]|uniref:LysR family transcriptional regulator n=1 Tax=Spirillospora sp. NPDC047279 TaxID=3155478 RepID=UPI0033C33525